MVDPRGFLKIKREPVLYRPVCERIKDHSEVNVLKSNDVSCGQASRCMDCGTPFCHWACPLGNLIPEWNDLMFNGHWQKALEILSPTNNFPEFTGRLCPAVCEYSCVLGINDDPVTIRENELSIIEYGFKYGLIKPRPTQKRTGKRVAVVGSGPAGLACADELNKMGHEVIVFEKDNKIGGMLRYGIPDFKLEKHIIDRRLAILKKEGIKFETSVNIDVGDRHACHLQKDFDAICLACGARVPRDLNIEGRDLKGIYFAMDYLTQSNRLVGNGFKPFPTDGNGFMDAKGKKVVVIGGGDTGADCVGVSNRQGARCMIQIELLPQPSKCRTQEYPWPTYPFILKNSSSHEEGCERKWAILTKRFIGDGYIKKLSCVNVDFVKDERGSAIMKELSGSEFEIEADMVILALGFLSPQKQDLVGRKGVFCAGDMRTGQSLIVRAMSDGRNIAQSIDRYLK